MPDDKISTDIIDLPIYQILCGNPKCSCITERCFPPQDEAVRFECNACGATHWFSHAHKKVFLEETQLPCAIEIVGECKFHQKRVDIIHDYK